MKAFKILILIFLERKFPQKPHKTKCFEMGISMKTTSKNHFFGKGVR
jgi:hypothetical protein